MKMCLHNIITTLRFILKEFLQQKIIYVFLLLAVLLLFLRSVIPYFDVHEQVKIQTDIGLTMFSVMSLMFILFAILPIFSQKYHGYIDALILLKPIQPGEYFIGKIVALLLVLCAFFVYLFCVSWIGLFLSGALLDMPTVQVFILLSCKYIVFFSVLVLLAHLTDSLLFYVCALVVFFLGHVLPYFESVFYQIHEPSMVIFCKILKHIFPKLYVYSLYDFVLLGKHISVEFMLGIIGYSCVYSMLTLLGGFLFFKRREY